MIYMAVRKKLMSCVISLCLLIVHVGVSFRQPNLELTATNLRVRCSTRELILVGTESCCILLSIAHLGIWCRVTCN